MIQFDVSIITRDGDPVLPGDGESVDGRICPDGSQRSSHVLQVPNADSPIVRTRNHFVRAREHSRCHGLGMTLNEGGGRGRSERGGEKGGK